MLLAKILAKSSRTIGLGVGIIASEARGESCCDSGTLRFVLIAGYVQRGPPRRVGTCCLKAHPRSSDLEQGICCKAPENDADHGKSGECGRGCGVTFEVACQPTIAIDSGEGPLDDPSFWQDFEACSIGALHDLQFLCSCVLDYTR